MSVGALIHIATVLTQLWRTLWWVDPAAASALSVYTFLYWLRSGRQQIDLIVGRSADPQFLEMEMRELAETHDPLGRAFLISR